MQIYPQYVENVRKITFFANACITIKNSIGKLHEKLHVKQDIRFCGSRLKNSNSFISYNIFPDYSLVVTNYTTINEALSELS